MWKTDATDYTQVLVYDVSRWGRFQDVDESAYYEYICKRSDVHVHYCAEQFENEWQLVIDVAENNQAHDGWGV